MLKYLRRKFFYEYEMKNVKTEFKIIFALTALFFAAFFGGIFTISSFGANAATGDYNKYPANTKVGYYAEYLGTAERKKPEVNSEGKATVFPEYGTELYGEGTSGEKSALWLENARLISNGLTDLNGASYDSMDKDGNLYLNGEKLERTLYKHKAAGNMYYGNLSDEEEAVIKKISYLSRTYGNHLTGLYAPAGEVITLTIGKADLEACGGLTVFVGQSFSDGKANIIMPGEAFNRMPIAVNAMKLNKNTSTREENEQDGTITFYFGSFLGGPIYLTPVNGGSAFTVTISGGVRYNHFITGYTTEEEFNENAASTAPYFDLEVWDKGVRHSGPNKFAKDYGYDDLYNAGVLWEKLASLTKQLPSNINKGRGIDFIYDCFVTSDLISVNTVNCSDSLLNDALNYNSIVTNGCSQILGEYNRRFRSGWGFADGEVTGNAVTLLEYSLFTDISSKRSDKNESEELEGLNAYSSASFSLRQLKKEDRNDIAVYATLLHSFGQDVFINAVDNAQTKSADDWFKSFIFATGRDMTYYFTELCKIELSDAALSWAASLKYPMFVPLACIYETGELYGLGDGYVSSQTVRPYVIESDASVEIDFDRVLELPYGFSYKIKHVSSPENGSIEKLNSHTYTYTPARTKEQSGKIYVKIGVERDDKSFETEDKVLILEFKQKGFSNEIFVSEHRYKDLNNAESVGGTEGFTRLSPDGIFTGNVGMTVTKAQSTFGHVYEGEQGSALEFTFYGTQFAVYSAFFEGYGEYGIYIDGGKSPVKTVNLGAKNEVAGLAYLSSSLTLGKHTVKIAGISGTFNIDSISIKKSVDPATVEEIPDLTPDTDSGNEDFRKPVDHPDTGDGNGGDDKGENQGGQNKPNGGNNYTGLIVGLSVGGVALVAAGIVTFIIIGKKRKQQ